jgi:hypothetical protein
MEEEFVYNESRKCQKSLLFTKCLFLLFHLFSFGVCFENIEKNKLGYYSATLLTIFLSTCNKIRYEYSHTANYGRIFTSPAEFVAWKKQQIIPYLKYSLDFLEYGFHILFLIQTWSFIIDFNKSELILYRVSCLFLHLYTILNLFIWICVFILICSSSLFSTWSSLPENANHSQQGRIEVFVDEDIECCICMDKNSQEWIRTQCNHSFHRECLNNWTNTNNTCPICRKILNNEL